MIPRVKITAIMPNATRFALVFSLIVLVLLVFIVLRGLVKHLPNLQMFVLNARELFIFFKCISWIYELPLTDYSSFFSLKGSCNEIVEERRC